MRAEFQEIDRSDLIVELQLGNEARQTLHPSRLASAVDVAVANVEVLSSRTEPTSAEPSPRHCSDVINVAYSRLSQVAQRAVDDDLSTAEWDRMDFSWHLAVPSVCRGRAIVGMSHRCR
jgi:hypothetical protein